VLVQPATVARWHRQGCRGWWSRRSRRWPGRPRFDSTLRALIRRRATENHLWGAPPIHGQLLKLGMTVSERTVSRYLPDRLTAPSQSWKTFFANHTSPPWAGLSGQSSIGLLRANGRLLAGVAHRMSLPPLAQTFQFWQGPSEVVARRNLTRRRYARSASRGWLAAHTAVACVVTATCRNASPTVREEHHDEHETAGQWSGPRKNRPRHIYEGAGAGAHVCRDGRLRDIDAEFQEFVRGLRRTHRALCSPRLNSPNVVDWLH
jgi:hypothetical protein